MTGITIEHDGTTYYGTVMKIRSTFLGTIVATAGAGAWENLPGTDIIVLHDSPSIWGSTPVGLADIRGDRVLIFKDHAAKWLGGDKSVAS